MILFFNPGHETAVQNASPYYMAPANVMAMQNELSFLPAWYGSPDDIVLINKPLDAGFCSLIQDLPFLPKAIIEEQLSDYQDAEVLLWGISPQAVHYFNGLNEICSLNLKVPEWKEEYTCLNSRNVAKKCLSKLTEKLPEIPASVIPQFYTKLEDIEDTVNDSPYQLLAKAPYSSSGRGLLWLPASGLTRTERQILHGILKKQGSVSVERVLDKRTDFAMEFMCDGKGGIEFAGYSLFFTNKKGAYESNYIGSQENIIKEITSRISLLLLERVKEELTVILKGAYAGIYKGCLGVDMMIYKEDGGYEIHPCLEVNMRYNMGYLAMSLHRNYISPLSYGRFILGFSAKEGEVFARHLHMLETRPAYFEDGRLRKGYLPLCPVNEHSRYWAYTLVED